MSNKFYMVPLTLILGEYEKNNKILVSAPSVQTAKLMALCCECHCNTEFDDGVMLDAGGEMGYTAGSPVEVAEQNIAVLRECGFNVHEYDIGFVKDILNLDESEIDEILKEL